MKSLFESILQILEDIGGGGGYIYAWGLDKPYREIPESDILRMQRSQDAFKQYYDMVCACGSTTRRHLEKSEPFKNLVERAWDRWMAPDGYNGNIKDIPFRFDITHHIKIAREYKDIIDLPTISANPDDKIDPVSLSTPDSGKIIIYIGNGNLFASAGTNGYKFENDIIETLRNYIYTYNDGDFHIDQLSINDPKILSTLKLIDSNEALKNDIAEIIDSYKKFDIIYETGAHNIQRDMDSMLDIIDKLQEDLRSDLSQSKSDSPFKSRSDKDMIEFLNNSGTIIADITVSGQDHQNKYDSEDIYISIKDKIAQLSGVVFSKTRSSSDNTCRWIDRVLGSKDKDHIPDADRKKFDTFFSMLGLDPDELIDIYINNDFESEGKMENGNRILKIDKTPSIVFSRFIQMLIGGNYWYINPSKVMWIPSKPINIKFAPTDAYIARPKSNNNWGKTIAIRGDLGDIKNLTIYIRTSGQGQYPYRIFPKISSDQLSAIIDKIGEE